jgi:hypothetical protein
MQRRSTFLNLQNFLNFILIILLFPQMTLSDVLNSGYSQNFDNMVPDGWIVKNRNIPVGSIPDWYQGIDPIDDSLSFSAYEGVASSYAAATYLGSDINGKIDAWLFSPEFLIKKGDYFSFYLRQQAYSGLNNINGYANALQVRLSSEGGSVEVGTGQNDVGDFVNILLDINPKFSLSGMPDEWKRFEFMFNGSDTKGRIGFRYYSPDVSKFGSYIGIDSFETTATVVPEPSSVILLIIGFFYFLYSRN